MRAILFLKGSMFEIYTLEDDTGESEIKNFLLSKSGLNIISGFIHMLDHIIDNGLNLPVKMRSCWSMRQGLCCELKKGKHRISYFRYENKLLLVSHFIKTQATESSEYNRAFDRKARFDDNPRWETDNGRDGEMV